MCDFTALLGPVLLGLLALAPAVERERQGSLGSRSCWATEDQVLAHVGPSVKVSFALLGLLAEVLLAFFSPSDLGNA